MKKITSKERLLAAVRRQMNSVLSIVHSRE